MVRKSKKTFGMKRQFSAGAAVPPPFLHSSILFTTKATAVPNWAEIMRVLLLVKKVAHPPPPLCHGSCFKEVQYGTVKKRRRNSLIFPHEKKRFISDENCLIWREKAKNTKFVGSGGSAAVSYCSILYLFIATAMPNIRAVTLYLVEFL